jgi:UDP-N-acetyl-2-amino-2-deoxyglucuronate dehydrogenase
MIADGAIGQIVSAAAYYYESMRDNVTSGSVDAESGGLGWRGSLKRAGGGVAIDGGLHWIRPLREMCGRIDSVVGVIRTHLAPELQMEGESLGHALFKITPPTEQQPLSPLSQPAGSGSLIATYSCNMLATAPMAHADCPYFRITGNKGELVIHGDGLFKEQPGAGGLRLYDQDNPTGKEMFAPDRAGGFFLGFTGLWQHIHQIIVDQDVSAAHETVVRAADDVRVVLALYKSSETGQWETV